MSMLAERKRKTKWVINPTKKPLWTTDSNGIKFGKELMEKMGWSAGKGLGVNEQGIQEPLRVSYKNDTKGMGFKGNDDDWIEQQDEFNELLCQLRKGNTSNVNVSEKEIKSLEEKSKQSRARVHYQKFTRGKDLSRYSENDLACILGTNKIIKKKSKAEEVIQMDSETPDSFETSFGVTTINSGSIQDYFKRKWIFDKNSQDLQVQNQDLKNCTQNSFESCSTAKNEENLGSDNKEKRFKKRKHKSCFEEELMNINKSGTNESDALKNFENSAENMKEKVENNLEETKAKKRKKFCDENISVDETLQGTGSKRITNNFGDAVDGNYESEILAKKKKSKDQKHLKLEDNSNCVIKKKRKSSYENGVLDVLTSEKLENVNRKESTLGIELNEKKKKKKSKKEKRKENCDIKDDVIAPIDTQSDGKEIETVLEIKFVKKKKKDNKENLTRSDKVKSTNYDINQGYDDTKEKIDELFTTENFYVKSINKKKKKKDKKENSDEELVEIECKDYFSSQIEEDLKEDVSVKQLECEIMTGFVKKKKEKKDKKEKKTKSINKEKEKKFKDEKVMTCHDQSHHNHDLNCHSDQISEFNLEVPTKENINDEINKTSVNKIISEMGTDNKKKNKKEKLEGKKINDGSFTEERSKEDSFEVKLVKRKKKNKDKKESEYLNQGMDCTEELIVKVSEQECTVEAESVKKKKTKKDKKEKEKKETKSSNQQSKEFEKLFLDETAKEKKINTCDQESVSKLKLLKEKDKKLENSCKPKAENNEKIQLQKLCPETDRKPNTETVDKKGFIGSNKVNNAEEEGKGVHQHKVAFLNEKRADKFYPGGYDRVLRLALWTNIAGFKGSNLEDVSGYGNTRKLERNKSR